MNPTVTRRAIYELPANVTLSFAAHPSKLQDWVNEARAQGHEVLIELPMDSINFNPNEPGALRTLRVNSTPASNIKNLDWLLGQAQGYFAVTNYNGDLLVRRSDILAPILTHLSDSGLGFVYDGSTQAPALNSLSASLDLPFFEAFTLLDTNTDAASIGVELLRLEQDAINGTTPIGVGFAFNNTIDQVSLWVSELERKNIELAPASFALNK